MYIRNLKLHTLQMHRARHLDALNTMSYAESNSTDSLKNLLFQMLNFFTDGPELAPVLILRLSQSCSLRRILSEQAA